MPDIAYPVDHEQEDELLADLRLRAEPLEGIPQGSSSSSSLSSRVSRNKSALSEMIRNSPPLPHTSPEVAADARSSENNGFLGVTEVEAIISRPTERTSLLSKSAPRGTSGEIGYSSTRDLESLRSNQRSKRNTHLGSFRQFRAGPRQAMKSFVNPKAWNGRQTWAKSIRQSLNFVPSVILGLLLNVLDALSYGR